MKNAKQKLGKLATLILSLFLIIASCSKDDAPEKKNDPTPNNPDAVEQDSVPVVEQDSIPIVDPTSADPDLVTQSLILDNMRIIEGQIPTSGKSSSAKSTLIELKIDSDTIFWTPGVVKRIKIKSPPDIDITKAWFCIPNANSYIEASIREAESTDEISIFYFEFNPSLWNLPVSFSAKIIPLGAGGEPICDPEDIYARPFLMEESYVNPVGSAAWLFEDCQIWRWQSFKDETNNVEAFAFAPKITPGTTLGSCDPSGLGPCDQGYIDDESVELNYESYSYIGDVYFALKSDGTHVTWEDVSFINLDICNSTFCGSPTAAYKSSHTKVTSEGKWIVRNDGTLQLNPENFDFDLDNDGIPASPMIGGGSAVQFKKISRHFLEETLIASPDLPDGLGGSVEQYELISGSDFDLDLGFEDLFWFDLVNPESDNSGR